MPLHDYNGLQLRTDRPTRTILYNIHDYDGNELYCIWCDEALTDSVFVFGHYWPGYDTSDLPTIFLHQGCRKDHYESGQHNRMCGENLPPDEDRMYHVSAYWDDPMEMMVIDGIAHYTPLIPLLDHYGEWMQGTSLPNQDEPIW